MRTWPARIFSTLLLCALCLLKGAAAIADAKSADQPPLHIFAAASLAAVLEDIGNLYQSNHQQPLLISYGASSTLARQISYGAPADVFISANPRWMQSLIDDNVIAATQSQELLHNSLLLVAPADSKIPTLEGPPSVEQLQAWLANGRLAVGDPQHVPVGMYAERSLRAAGLWQAAQSHLAPTEDARASLALLQRAEVALGIVYNSDLLSAPELKVISQLPLPEGEQISYPLAIVAEDSDGSRAQFVDFLRSEQAQSLFRQFGFTPAQAHD